MTSAPAVRRLGVLDAAGRGAAWGGAAAGWYALALGALLALHTVVNSVAQEATGELGRAPVVAIVAVLVAAVVAVPVGAVCGCALGMAALPLARALPPRQAGWIAATVVFLGGLAVLLAVQFGSRGGGVDAVLYFCVLPALLAAGGAYQHTSRLSSRHECSGDR